VDVVAVDCTALFDELGALAVDGFEFEFSEVQPAAPIRIATSTNTTHAVSTFLVIRSASRTSFIFQHMS
jgi:hypothetical protein